MLLALDMGNTNITIGVYEKDSGCGLNPGWPRTAAKMEDQYAVEIMDILRLVSALTPREIEGRDSSVRLFLRWTAPSAGAVEKITGVATH